MITCDWPGCHAEKWAHISDDRWYEHARRPETPHYWKKRANYCPAHSWACEFPGWADEILPIIDQYMNRHNVSHQRALIGMVKISACREQRPEKT